MAPRLPAGFTSVADAHQSKRDSSAAYDVVGVCTDYLPPAQSRGSDLTMKLTLWDVTCLDTSGLGQDGMVIRFFAKERWQLPRIESIGDAVILRHLRTKNHGSQWFGLSNSDTRWNVIPCSTLLDSDLSNVQQRPAYDGHTPKDARQGPPPTIEILKYAHELLRIKDPTTLRGPPRSTALDQPTIIEANGSQPPAAKQKHRLLKELLNPREIDRHQYVDLVGEVRRVFHGGNPIEIQVTDYTENSLLFDYTYPDPDGYVSTTNYWPGPWGQRTITVCAWDEHAEHVRQLIFNQEVTIGMYVRMKNVQIAMDRNGGMIQGHIRGVPGSSRSNIEFLKPIDAEYDENLKRLLERRRQYNTAMKSRGIGFQQEGANVKKRKVVDEVEEPAEQEKKKPKSNRTRKKEEGRKQNQAGVRCEATADVEASTTKAVKITSNKHIKCETVGIPLMTVSSILNIEQLRRQTPTGNAYQLPFQNCKYRSRVQVVDFFPDNLEDFTTPRPMSDRETLSGDESDTMSAVSPRFAQDNPNEVRWEWHFFLMVEDPQPMRAQKALQTVPAQSTMLLQVAGMDGEYLLNMKACDLKKNSQALVGLKERLFVLWGDLEEMKKENAKTGQELQDEGVTISSKPFECLIKEYGVNARTQEGHIVDCEWERMFGLFKTSIG